MEIELQYVVDGEDLPVVPVAETVDGREKPELADGELGEIFGDRLRTPKVGAVRQLHERLYCSTWPDHPGRSSPKLRPGSERTHGATPARLRTDLARRRLAPRAARPARS